MSHNFTLIYEFPVLYRFLLHVGCSSVGNIQRQKVKEGRDGESGGGN